MTFYLIAKGKRDEATLKAILELGEGTEERYEGEWFLYNMLARKAAERATMARYHRNQENMRKLRKARRQAEREAEKDGTGV